jgi:germination protein M
VAQVVCTLTQFATIRSVAFRIDGEPVKAIGGEGVVVNPPVGRADFEGVMPQVLLESVWPGAVVSSPIPFAGTANTFEATVLWRVERPDGTTVSEGHVEATSGTGTRGTFDARLDLGSFTGPAVMVTGGDNAKGGGGFADEYRVPFTVS